MAENTKKPAIRFTGFTEAWEQRKLSELTENIDTGKSKFVSKDSGNYEILGSTSIIGFDDHYDYEGDFLLTARVGVNAGNLYRHAGKVKISDNTVFIQGSHIDFLYYLLEKFDLKRLSFGTGQPLVKASELRALSLTVPSDDQEKEVIGDYFKRLDSLITLHQRKYEKLTSVKKSMLEKMFPKNGSNVPEIRFKGFTEAWEQRKLGEVGTITTGNTPSTAVTEYYSDDGIIWVTPTDISKNFTYETEKKLSKLGRQVGRVVPKNTILVTCIASIGKNTMLGNTGSFNQQINGLTPNENKYEPYFLLTESELWSAQMKKSAAAGTMQIVNRTEFSELKTWIPTLDEQKIIGTYFRNLDNLITLHQRKLEKLKNIKKSMLEKMFI